MEDVAVALDESQLEELLLDADEFYFEERRANGELTDQERKTGRAAIPAYFKTHAERYQKKFVTVYKLLERPQLREAVLESLIKRARILKSKTGYTSIIACTVTAKNLLDRIHADLEDVADELQVLYLGNYPFLNPENQDAVNLEQKRVLILTDVTSSGTLVKRLARVVRHVGGTPIGALAFCNLDKGIRETQVLPLDDGTELRVDSIFHPRIETFPKPPESNYEAIPISPLTVLPTEPTERVRPNRHDPLVDRKSTIRQLKAANALRFGFYRGDRRRLSAAVNLERFVSFLAASEKERAKRVRAGEELNERQDIWSSWSKVFKTLEHWLEPQPTKNVLPSVISTFSPNDQLFAEFMLNERLADTKPIYLPGADSIEARHSYFVPQAQQKFVKDRPAVILLGSVNTGEKLTNLVAELAAQGATRISILCLVNRLGPRTKGFIQRIKKLMGNAKAIDFELASVFDIPEFQQADLLELSQRITTLTSYYTESTKGPELWSVDES